VNRIVDLHTHTYYSDGTLSPTELVRKAKNKGLAGLAITDHDTTAGVPEGIEAGQQYGVEVIPGVEISAIYDHGTLHILGYFIDINNSELQANLKEYINARNRRNPLILQKLNDLGYPMSMEEVEELAGGEVVNRPHIAQAMVNRGYVQTKKEAFDRFIAHGGIAYVPKEVFSPEQAIDIIHNAGGVAVIAHPDQLGHPELSLTLTELRKLAEYGVDGIEAYHGECHPDHCDPYAHLARELGLFVTGGSDFHGDMKHQDLGTISGRTSIPYEYVKEMQIVSQKYRNR
jgi:predicted metal-dependent phosphoesterase TrpH